MFWKTEAKVVGYVYFIYFYLSFIQSVIQIVFQKHDWNFKSAQMIPF